MADVEVLDKPDKEQLDAPEHRFDDDEEEDEILPDEQPSPKQPLTQPKNDAPPLDNDEDMEEEEAPPPQTTPPSSTQRPKRSRHDAVADEGDGAAVMADNDDSPEFTRRFEKIIADTASSSSEAKAWLGRVLYDGPRAVADILAIVVSPAVVRASADAAADLLTQRTVMANDPARSVRELCEALEDTSRSAEGILVTSKKSRGHFQNFWQRIAADSSDAILYDTDCFDTLLTWLEAMSTAKLSIMRHAACIAAYSIVDGLIASVVKLRVNLVALQQQLKVEKKKCEKKKKKGAQVEWSEKYKRLSNEVDEAAANNGELVELADKVFTGVFVLKYRDVAAEIRIASVEFLGKWIMRYPDHYLDDTHTKYIGWLLSDKDAGVRRACLAALGEMLKHPDCLQALELFLRRFLSRIVEMCHDRDNDVSVRALRVCALLVPYDILDQEATENLCELLHEESNSAVRKAAGEFVVAFITDPDDEAPVLKKKSGGRSRKKPILNEGIPGLNIAMELLRELIDVCVKEDAPEPDAALVLDAVWEVMPALRSWQAFAALLEDDGENAMEEDHKALLAELLVVSAKQVVADEPAPRKTGKKKLDESCKDALARIFTPLIPKLLVRYQDSSRILAALVQVPKYFSDVHFTESATKKHFLQLLTRLVEAISRHTGSKDVLDAAVGTFKTMLSDDHPLNMLANESLAKASKETAKELRVLVASGIEEQDAVAVGAAVLKARVISNLKALPEGTVEDILTILDTVLEKRLPVQFNTVVVTDACHVAVRQWLWNMLRAAHLFGNKQDVEGEEDDDEDDTERKEMVEKLQNTLDEMQKRLAKFAEYPYNLRVRVASAQSICSMLSVHANMKLRIGKNEKDGDIEMKEGEKEDVEMKDDEQIPVAELSCTAVQECVLDLIVEQWGLPSRHPKVTSRYEDLPAKEAHVPQQEVTALCTALIQVCLTSSVPERFLHFPFLAFLLNRELGAQPVESVCKVFLSRKLQLKHDVCALVVDALKCVADVPGTQRERKHQVVSLLARALMESVPKKGNIELFSDVLKTLLQHCDGALESKTDATVPVSILGKVNAFFAPRLDIDAASAVLVKCREMKEKIKTMTSLDEEERNQLGLLIFPVVQLLETISSGEEAAIPTPLKKLKLPKPTSRGRRKRLSEKTFAGPKVVVSTEGLRRSKRQRKPVKLDLYDESSSEEEEEEEDEEIMEEEEEAVMRTTTLKSRKKSKLEEEEEEADEDVAEDVTMRTPPRSRRKSKRKDDEELDGEEEEVMPTPRTRSERMSARKEAPVEQSEEEELEMATPASHSSKKAESENSEKVNLKAAPTRRSTRNSSGLRTSNDEEVKPTLKRRSKRKSNGKKSTSNEDEDVVPTSKRRLKKKLDEEDEEVHDGSEEKEKEEQEEKPTRTLRSRRKSASEKKATSTPRSRRKSKKEEDEDKEEKEKATPTPRSRKKSASKEEEEDDDMEEVEEEKATPTPRSRRKSASEKAASKNEDEKEEEENVTPTPRSRKKSGSRYSSADDDEEAPPTVRSQKKRTRRKSSTESGKLSVDEALDMGDGIDCEVRDERGLIVEGVDEAEDEINEDSKSKDIVKTEDVKKDDDDDDIFEEKKSDGKEVEERDAPTSKETEAVEEGKEEDDDDDLFEEEKAEPKVGEKGANGAGTKRRERDEVAELPDKPVLRRKKQKRW